MEYKAFALQYRPQTFDEVIGQDTTVNALKTAISTNRIHHAYLFSGPRGVGKTSLARIFAKALNCEKGPTVSPCGVCANCTEVNKGTSLDVIEIDGASNRRIDDIRELRESAKLSTVNSRFKIYIIDEVHMLVDEAFNALLKTLEEPPAHVKFLFATTHPHKVIPTILSRCQKFALNLLSTEKIVEKLKVVAKNEKIKIDEALLYSIARAAAGSIRDAESLFDQLAPVLMEQGSVGDILSFLGVIDEGTLNASIEALLEKNCIKSLEIIDSLAKSGKDLGIFLNGMVEQLRAVVLAKVSPKAFKELSEISQASRDLSTRLAQKVTLVELLRAVDVLLSAKELSHRLNSVRIPLELGIIRFANQEELNKAVIISAPKAENKVAPAVREIKMELKDEFEMEIDNIDMEQQPPVISMPKSKGETDNPSGPDDNILMAQVKPRWVEIMAKMQKVRVAVASHLGFARLVSSSGSMLCIGFSKKDLFHKESIEGDKNRTFIEKFITDILGKKVDIKFAAIEGESVKAEESLKIKKPVIEEAPQSGDELEGDDEFVNEILDAFDGKLDTGK